MVTKVGSKVHPWYKGSHEWQVDGIVELSKPIEYVDSIQGDVKYAPKILKLSCPEHRKVLWFAYWSATSKTKGKLKWGQGPPMLEESALQRLLTDAIRQDFFNKGFLKNLKREIESALSK